MTTVRSGPAPGEPVDLLAAVRRGDEAAFRALYRRYTPRLRLLVLRILGGNAADSDDAVQETWIRAMAGLERFRGDSAFGTWLNGIGIRTAWELIRKHRDTIPITPDHDRGADAPDTAERLDLEDALRRLPDAYRTVVVLHDVEGLGHDEIAAWLDIAVGTSRSHLHRARRQLRSMLCSYERVAK